MMTFPPSFMMAAGLASERASLPFSSSLSRSSSFSDSSELFKMSSLSSPTESPSLLSAESSESLEFFLAS